MLTLGVFMPTVVKNHFSRTDTDIEWPWEVTGDDGSAIKDWGDSVRARIDSAKQHLVDNYGATYSEVVVDDLNCYLEVTFPDRDTYDSYLDYVNTDPDFVPAVPSIFGLTKSVEIVS